MQNLFYMTGFIDTSLNKPLLDTHEYIETEYIYLEYSRDTIPIRSRQHPNDFLLFGHKVAEKWVYKWLMELSCVSIKNENTYF